MLVTGLYAEEGGTDPFGWNSSFAEAGNVLSLSSAWASEGTYSYQYYFGGSNDALISWSDAFAGMNEAWLIFDLNIDSGFAFSAAGNYLYFISLYGTSTAVTIRIYAGGGDGTPTSWRISGTDLTTTITAAQFGFGAKHFKIYFLRGSSENGIIRIYVDGNLIFEDTAVTNDFQVTNFQGGGNGQAPVSGSLFRIDNLEIHNSDPDVGGGNIAFGGLYGKALSGGLGGRGV